MEDAAADTLGGEPYYYYREVNESGPGAHCKWPADWEVSFSLLPLLFMLVFKLGLSGNGLVIFTMCWSLRAKHRSADTYIGNRALANLAFVVTLHLWAAYLALRFHWPFGLALCKLSSYLVLFNMFTSDFCLDGLSFERYLAIMCSLLRSGPCAPALLLLVALWLLAGLLVLPTLLLCDTQTSLADNQNATPGNVPPQACVCFAGA